MWLFLSTEIMFFAGLLGSYIVLRFGAPPGRSRTMSISPRDLGAFNTFVLICSSVTVVLALEAAKTNKTGPAKSWMLLTLLLGGCFSGSRATSTRPSFPTASIPPRPTA